MSKNILIRNKEKKGKRENNNKPAKPTYKTLGGLDNYLSCLSLFFLKLNMSSLLAILLVVNSTRGHHYLFSYPPNPKRPSSNRTSNERTKDFTVGSSIASRNLTPDNNDENRRASNASKSNDNNPDIFAGRDTIFNLDVSFLADTLAPKLPLCDGKFQLSMDDLTFVGHPVSLSTLQHDQQEQNDNHEQQNELGSPISPNSQFISPPPPPISQPPLTSPSNDMIDGNTGDDNESLSDTSPGSTSIHMTLFHVVFVMTPPDLELNAQVETIYKNVILRYSSALRYEQLRCGYVQEEIEKVLGLKEEAFNKGNHH